MPSGIAAEEAAVDEEDDRVAGAARQTICPRDLRQVAGSSGDLPLQQHVHADVHCTPRGDHNTQDVQWLQPSVCPGDQESGGGTGGETPPSTPKTQVRLPGEAVTPQKGSPQPLTQRAKKMLKKKMKQAAGPPVQDMKLATLSGVKPQPLPDIFDEIVQQLQTASIDSLEEYQQLDGLADVLREYAKEGEEQSHYDALATLEVWAQRVDFFLRSLV